ncbi:2Fe-2S iron-sulfur cluster-binding protein [Streptomyces sp. NPDC056069]|uniref:2Fe-2S iron-sulfur cluster-binding protein n=1 Tax=Streptomyces sp. NPDC056069 TaxID=3345702 RepID=UPI0035DA67EC
MSDAHKGQGGWEPIPQSEGYDGDATAFVQLPPEFMLEGTPLEAPGHGYVPPMIVPLTPLSADPSAADPSATGTWAVQQPMTGGSAPQAAGHETSGHGAYSQETSGHGVYPQETSGHGVFPQEMSGHGAFTQDHSAHDHTAHDLPAHDHAVQAHAVQDHSVHDLSVQEQTGQWTIPTVEGDAEALEDSGEYTTSRLAQYASSAPATLPGGAPAPWAVPAPEAAGDSAPQHLSEPEQAAAPEGESEPDHTAVPDHPAPADHAADPEPGPEGWEPETVPSAPADHAPVDHLDPADHAPADHLDPADHAPVDHLDPADHAPVDPFEAIDHAALDAVVPVPVDMSIDSDEHPHTSYTLRVNGADRPVTDSWIGESLLYVLRERLGLAGAKDGCSQGECGACNVQVDGRLVASCLVPAATAAGCEVRTVEGLAVNGEPSDVQRALAKCGVQCGFCIPGMAMTVHDLLEGNHAPTELETRQALCGNLCRCSGYRGVLDAVKEVVAGREAEAGDEARIPHQIPHPHDGGTA